LTGTTPSYLTNHDDTVQAGEVITDADYLCSATPVGC
jgi:putative ABC transport system permease protein